MSDHPSHPVLPRLLTIDETGQILASALALCLSRQRLPEPYFQKMVNGHKSDVGGRFSWRSPTVHDFLSPRARRTQYEIPMQARSA